MAAAAVVLAAPFEAAVPWVVVPGQRVSSLELVFAAALGLWGSVRFLEWLRGRRRSRGYLTVPLALVAAAMLVAALAAPEHRGEALRFLGRFGAGLLIYRLFADLEASRRTLFGLLALSAVPAALVGVAGVLEYLQVPAVEELLERFRGAPTYAGGQVRVSSTLHYPTIAAMYLEIVFAWLLGLLAHTASEGRRRVAAAIFLVLLAAGTSLLVTSSRAAILVLGALLAAAGLASLRRPRALLALGALAVLLTGSFALLTGGGQDVWLRLTTFDQRDWYLAGYQVPDRLRLSTGEVRLVPVEVTNRGLAAWTPGSETPFHLSYHWLTPEGGSVAEFEGLRTELPHPVRPGQTVRLQARVRAPQTPGRYRLAWDMLQEHRFWFSQEFSPSAFTEVAVSGAPAGPPPALRPVPGPRFLLDRPAIWSHALDILWDHPLLGIGPDNFRLTYGRYAELEVSDLTYHTHNLYLEFFVSAGLLGGILFLWFVWRAGRLALDAAAAGSLLLGPALAVLAVLLHGCFDYFLQFTPTYGMIFAAFGLLETAARAASVQGGDSGQEETR